MPRILEMKEIDGRLAVFLELPLADPSPVTLWTEAEKASALQAEREACAKIAESLEPSDAVIVGSDETHTQACDLGQIEAGLRIAATIRARQEEWQ